MLTSRLGPRTLVLSASSPSLSARCGTCHSPSGRKTGFTPLRGLACRISTYPRRKNALTVPRSAVQYYPSHSATALCRPGIEEAGTATKRNSHMG